MPKVGEPFNPYGLFRNALIPERVLFHVELSQGAKLTWGLLRKYAGEQGVAFPHQATLAADLGVGARQVKRYIAELVREKLIRALPHHHGKRGNAYEFLWNSCLKSGQLPLVLEASGDMNVPSRGDTYVPSTGFYPYTEEVQLKRRERLHPGPSDSGRQTVVENSEVSAPSDEPPKPFRVSSNPGKLARAAHVSPDAATEGTPWPKGATQPGNPATAAQWAKAVNRLVAAKRLTKRSPNK